MLKRFGNTTIATNGANAGVYYQPTPYESYFVGLTLTRIAAFGSSHTPGVRAYVLGPLTVGRYRLNDALQSR